MDIKGYTEIKQENIEDIYSTGYLFQHQKSGAKVCVLSNQEENKVFYAAFRTPPSDSTGVAHILEHSVLCGSKHFPSKDPFVELVKGSLNTFLNAMTYPDKTMYPVASCNDTDFKNLMHVYMDAVFYPNIYQKEEIFRQEGWSYQLEHEEGELSYNGVVYNEMKGAFSSPEDVLDREILNSLYPDTTYGNESGGDPEKIPDLTYENFLDFHRKYYHPSNCYLYLYGNMDVEERLRWLDENYLSQYGQKEVDSKILRQPAFDRPREVYKKYSISNTDSTEDNTYLSWNASIGTSLDVQLSNAFAVMEYALLSAPGAPLKQALLDAQIGKDVMGSYDSGTYQPMFSVIVKNANSDKKEEFLKIVRQVLSEIAEQGMDEKALLAGIHYMEFRFREADYGSFPKGLMYGIDLMDAWLYDEHEPFAYLKQLSIFDFLRKQVGTGYFEGLIRTWLLENSHVSIVVVEPEKGLTGKMEEATRQKLKAYKESLTTEEIQQIIENTKKLTIFQETPSTEEELLTIPMLSREDIRKEAMPFQNEKQKLGGTDLLFHPVETNGIVYLNLLFDTKYVKKEHLPYLGILKATLGMIDTEHYSYGELYNEIHMRTGGIYASVDVYPNRKQPNKYRTTFSMKAKTLSGEMEFVGCMLEEILFTSKLEDEKRLYEIIAQIKSRAQMHLNSAGHSTAAVRSMSYFSDTAAFNEAVSGISFYKIVEEIEQHFEEKKDKLISILKELVHCIFRKDNLMIDCTTEEKELETIRKPLEHLLQKLPEEPFTIQEQIRAEGKRNEGFQTSAKIQYVARSGNFCKAGFSYTGALRILKVILSYEYLWTNVRVKGGAYGCMSGFGVLGDAYFVSYRDPHLKGTNQVYDHIPEYVEQFTASDRDMTKYIIGTISEMDTPLTPMAQGIRSLNAYMTESTQEDVQRERDEVLHADQNAIRALSRLLEAVLAQENICVIGNEEKLAKDKEMFMELVPFIG